MSDNNKRDEPLAPETLAAQALGKVDPATGALVPPLHPSTTYQRDADGRYSLGRGYTRPHNPTYDEPEELLARLEGGADCLVFASGMAAASAVFQSLLPGDHVVASRIMYWALRTWLIDFAMTWGLDVEFVDTCDPAAVAAAMRPGRTRLLWLDTPANPTWAISDIAAMAEIAHSVHARLAVDSTAASPVLTRPIEFGADLVVHSASKYLNGHSDVLAGAIVCAREDALWNRIKAWRRDAGAVLGPFEAWLLLRGMRTLYVRVRHCSETALRIAERLAENPDVADVLYPGLPSHPDHAVAAQQMNGGFGGMLSIRVRGGEAAAVATAAAVQVFKRATSLGGVESLIEHRASIEGPSTPVPTDLLRLSIGLEHGDDLIADLEQALDAAASKAPAVAVVAEVSSGAGVAGDGLAAMVEQLLSEKVRPLLADRGGDLHLVKIDEGIAHLAVSGSPGAAVPIRASIANLFRHYVPGVEDVRIDTGGVTRGPEGSQSGMVQQVLDEQINPAIADHGGSLYLKEVAGNTAYVCFEGRCQGCAMANVTLRQGVEILLKEGVPTLVAVVDVTDHTAGLDPYFKTKKGSE
jgi:cystathionine gamma-synthase